MTTKRTIRALALVMLVLCATAITANATVAVSKLFGNSMVLQRGRPVPVAGTAAPNKLITVAFNSQSKTTTSDAQGNWQLALDAMPAIATGSTMTITEAGANTITISDVVVGDVWICSGQSNAAMSLGGCNRQAEDVNTANFPGIRHFWVWEKTSRDPLKYSLTNDWAVCTPGTAANFSAIAFYFARKIYQDQGGTVPIGMITSSIGGTVIDIWLAPEGLSDIPAIQPLYTQEIVPWGPFSAFNGMVHPLAPYSAKGMIWYQGENREKTNQVTDSYYLKEKALQQGWKRLFGLDDFALYVVQLANWLDPATTDIPDAWGSWSDTRQMQEMVNNLPHAGAASAMDVGEAADIHPKDKLDVGERLALWALKNDYGRTSIVPSGPVLKNITVSGRKLILSFDYVGSGLMVGSKTPYQPTTEVVGGTLQRFVIAEATGSWVPATATIVGNTVEVSSGSLANPRKVAYAYWMNPSGANLYNKEGLPASPFCVDDVTAKYTVTATPGANGSISPAGSTTYLKRRTALYTITPDAGYYIQDVKVDNVSVGAVKYYTFDPLYANHTITATFAQTQPTYTATASSNAWGTVSPSGTVNIAQGGSQTFNMVPNANCRLISVVADGAPLGRRDSVTFSDVRTNHTVSGTFAIIPTPSAGTGLRGDYYAGSNFDTFRVSRTDATVNFDWGAGSPNAAIPVDGFSVRWTGQIEPQFTETYKFYLNHDEGARLWINNQLVINNWGAAGTDDNGSISLVAGQKYPIKLEYNEGLGNASCKLEWMSPSLPREFVPQSQLYPATTAIYSITATAGANGSFSPSGTVLANSGASQTFNVLPAIGYYVADVKVDNVSVGAVPSYTFTNIVANHTITATFTAMPSYTVSGKVTKQGTSTAISGATVCFYTSSNTIGNPAYTATTNATGDYSISIPMGTWSANASASGYFTSSTQLVTVSNAPAGNINFSLADGTRNIPRTADLLFSYFTDSLPASGAISTWASYQPVNKPLTKTGSPTVETIMGRKWEKNIYSDYDGFSFGTYSSPIPCSGVSVVAVVKPTYISVGGEPRGEVIDVFYSDIFLAVNHGTGEVIVCHRGYDQHTTGYKIPDGQTTVLSLIAQTGGGMELFANGTSVWTTSSGVDYTQLIPTGFNAISVGKNAWDAWSTYNGYIGDLFLYKAALSTAERQALEADLAKKFINGGATTYTINASAGAGGTVSPAGSVSVNPAASQTFTIAANAGYAISDVTVDGVSQGARTSYTFTSVNANHSISATFMPAPATIADFKAIAAGTLVKLSGTKIAIYAPKNGATRSTNFFYVGEAKALGGLKVVDKTSDTLTLGNQVTNLTGYVRKPAGSEVYLELTGTPSGSGNTPIKPVGINNKAALTDFNVLTNTVRVFGKVKSTSTPTSFVISDGYDSIGITVMINGISYAGTLDNTKSVVVTGIITTDNIGNVVVQAQDIRIL